MAGRFDASILKIRMSYAQQPLDFISGIGKSPAHFDILDMMYRLRMRAFVGLCMPPIFAGLEQHLKMMPLRRSGYAPVMFFLDFRSGLTPIAFGRALQSEFSLRMYRSITDANNQPAVEGTERLLFDCHVTLQGKARSHGPETLGFDDGSGEMIEAGSAEIMHVITRPVASAGDRQVKSVPEELRVLREHRWDKPLPSVENLGVPPKDYERLAAGLWEERRDTWGIPNTDINQHVNVLEYITGGENQFSRLLHGAGLPVAKHHISRARLLFRKPFFPGQTYLIRSELYRRDRATQMHAGFYLLDGEEASPKASSFVVYDGLLGD